MNNYFVNLTKHTDISMTAVQLLKIFMKIKKSFYTRYLYLFCISFEFIVLATSLFCFLTCLVKSFGNVLRMGEVLNTSSHLVLFQG